LLSVCVVCGRFVSRWAIAKMALTEHSIFECMTIRYAQTVRYNFGPVSRTGHSIVHSKNDAVRSLVVGVGVGIGD